MDFVEIKNLARTFKAEDEQALIQQVFKLKQQGVGLLGAHLFCADESTIAIKRSKNKDSQF
ncbi:hypothetical protein [Acinetobacter bereziniae]|uniref:hypothetical protein n=1 Tax=Acinetobacter bereziniae TaxID=106648 RepID=UPI00208EB959|nr:hypothetical protein [Acinetobacter bereziniae]